MSRSMAAVFVALAVLGGRWPAARASFLRRRVRPRQARDARRQGHQGRVDEPARLLLLDVAEPGGAVGHWAIEGGAPNSLYRAGWRKDSLKVGDVVTVHGYLARDGSKLANMRTATLPDGRAVFGGQQYYGTERRHPRRRSRRQADDADEQRLRHARVRCRARAGGGPARCGTRLGAKRSARAAGPERLLDQPIHARPVGGLGTAAALHRPRRRTLAHRGHVEGPDRHLPAGRGRRAASRRRFRSCSCSTPTRCRSCSSIRRSGGPSTSMGAAIPTTSPNIPTSWAIRWADGRATRWWSTRPASTSAAGSTRRATNTAPSCGSPSGSEDWRRHDPVDRHLRRPRLLHAAVVDHAHLHARQARRPAAALHVQREQQGRGAPAEAPAEPEVQAHARARLQDATETARGAGNASRRGTRARPR